MSLRDVRPAQSGPEWEARLTPWLYGAFFLAVLYGLFLSASFFRPIWIDEFVNFAMGAGASLPDAWFIVDRTTVAVNHGHTGAYLLFSYLGLSQFGASAVLLRLPALLSGAWLMLLTVQLFRILRFSIAWQVLAVMALFGQALIVYFIGEARTYMPLTASVVGLLVYYVGRARGCDSGLLNLTGIASASLGVIISPYIAVYWPAMAAVGYYCHLLENRQAPRLGTLIRFVNPLFVAVGIAGFVLIGALTWMRGSPVFSYDPFQWIRSPSIWSHLLQHSHIQFLSAHKRTALVLTIAATGAAILLSKDRKAALTRLFAPCLLLLVTAAVSALLAYASYRMNYWILGRQFTASAALVALGVVWLWAESARLLAQRTKPAGIAIGLVAAFVLFGHVRINHDTQWSRLRSEVEAQNRMRADLFCTPPASAPHGLPLQQANDTWVAEANRNILCGGPVWPIFRTYYPAWDERRASPSP